MSIKIECENCGAKRKVNDRLAGRVIRCPGCEQPLTIPQVEAPVAAVEVIEAEPALAAVPVLTADPVAAQALAAEPIAAQAAVPTATQASPGTAPSRAPSTPTPEPRRDDDDEDDGIPPRQKREDGELDMTPMVDVTFLLLIFFMVTASFSLQKSIQMPRQNSDLPSMSNQEEETEELDPIELEIDESGAFLVLAQEWERETPGKQNLITALKQAIGDNRDGMKLDIKVHENAELQMLVDGMDAGTIAGFAQIQVTEVDGFD
ncbi:biopolymer transport protein ExbD [Neorhodopirellula lusitana]|uniref:Biopolymer transport protein ExbD n=1 Tax=Neorhodopirellula lusitana TaxID=445327 RepID=A0ABY1Q5P9_9BACT|nr:biopolymer transporter ExbD [Neorhodopirellula lusitana]SMP56517.1 biopolymer transport protein ExbD [Neorhodopirellula lusitana]